MKCQLRFHPKVPHDLANAIAWYDEISPEISNRFRNAIRDIFARIESQPELSGVVFDDVRAVRVTRFPYLVQYRIDQDFAIVLGVFHSASNPESWQSRAAGKDQ